jgi:hypothetical protein
VIIIDTQPWVKELEREAVKRKRGEKELVKREER